MVRITLVIMLAVGGAVGAFAGETVLNASASDSGKIEVEKINEEFSFSEKQELGNAPDGNAESAETLDAVFRIINSDFDDDEVLSEEKIDDKDEPEKAYDDYFQKSFVMLRNAKVSASYSGGSITLPSVELFKLGQAFRDRHALGFRAKYVPAKKEVSGTPIVPAGELTDLPDDEEESANEFDAEDSLENESVLDSLLPIIAQTQPFKIQNNFSSYSFGNASFVRAAFSNAVPASNETSAQQNFLPVLTNSETGGMTWSSPITENFLGLMNEVGLAQAVSLRLQARNIATANISSEAIKAALRVNSLFGETGWHAGQAAAFTSAPADIANISESGFTLSGRYEGEFVMATVKLSDILSEGEIIKNFSVSSLIETTGTGTTFSVWAWNGSENAAVQLVLDTSAQSQITYAWAYGDSGLILDSSWTVFVIWSDDTEGVSVSVSELSSFYETALLPEPSAFGLLAGLGALALVGARRRRSRK